MNTGRTLRRIEEIAYLSATQKAIVNVTSKLKWMQTSAIYALIAKDKEILAAAEKLAKKEQSHAEIEKG